jgi:hypothetical protein
MGYFSQEYVPDGQMVEKQMFFVVAVLGPISP